MADSEYGRRDWQSATPDDGPQSSQQLAKIERLDEVVVGAAVETGDARLDRIACRQHEDGHV